MPLPPQSQFQLQTFRPETVDQHETNLRQVERAFAGLPFFPETIWRKKPGATAVSWTPSNGNYQTIKSFWWDKTQDWTRIRMAVDMGVTSSAATLDVWAIVTFTPGIANPLTFNTTQFFVAGRRVTPGVSASVSGFVFDTEVWATPATAASYYVSLIVYTQNLSGGPGTLTVGTADSISLSIQEAIQPQTIG